jgi:hypothetical protein
MTLAGKILRATTAAKRREVRHTGLAADCCAFDDGRNGMKAHRHFQFSSTLFLEMMTDYTWSLSL